MLICKALVPRHIFEQNINIMVCPNCSDDYMVKCTDRMECPSCEYTEDRLNGQLTLALKTTDELAAEANQLQLFQNPKIERRSL